MSSQRRRAHHLQASKMRDTYEIAITTSTSIKTMLVRRFMIIWISSKHLVISPYFFCACTLNEVMQSAFLELKLPNNGSASLSWM